MVLARVMETEIWLLGKQLTPFCENTSCENDKHKAAVTIFTGIWTEPKLREGDLTSF